MVCSLPYTPIYNVSSVSTREPIVFLRTCTESSESDSSSHSWGSVFPWLTTADGIPSGWILTGRASTSHHQLNKSWNISKLSSVTLHNPPANSMQCPVTLNVISRRGIPHQIPTRVPELPPWPMRTRDTAIKPRSVETAHSRTRISHRV